MSEKSRRLSVLKKACKESGADCAVITNFGRNPNFYWLTNCAYGSAFFWDFRSRPLIIADSIEAPLCRKAWARCDSGSLREFMQSLKGRAAADFTNMTADFYSSVKGGVKFADVSDVLAEARSVKSIYEIRQIRKACVFTKEVFSQDLLNGRTERRIFASIRRRIAEAGLEEAFSPIVASGSGIASPHHSAGMQSRKGALLIDAGVRFNGYCSDVTRTYGSKHSWIGERIHEAAAESIRDGVSCRELDEKAREMMGKYSKYFITSLGHGIGVSVHEAPSISSKSSAALRKNNVITIEPGIYIRNGMRIENIYLVGKNCCKNLTAW